MKRIITLCMILAFATGILFAQAIFEENFNSSTNLPTGWVDDSYYGVEIRPNIGVNGTNALWFNVFDDDEDWDDLDLYTPVISNIPAGSVLTFDYRIMQPGSSTIGADFGYADFTIYVCDPAMEDFEELWYTVSHTVSADYETVTIELDDFAGMSGRINFYVYYGNFDFHLDNVKVAPAANIDLRAMSLAGETTITVGQLNQYTLTIRNMGALPVTAGSYQVFLQENAPIDDPIDLHNGDVAIAPGATADITLNFTPSNAGATQIRGVVAITGDENQNNNATQYLSINVLPIGQEYTPLLSEGFDTTIIDTIPNYWSQIANNPAFPWQAAASIVDETIFYPHNFSAGMIVSTSWNLTTEPQGPLDPDNWLITPQLEIPASATSALLEYYVATWLGYPEYNDYWQDHYGVFISTTTNSVGSFGNTPLLQETPPGSMGGNSAIWSYRTINLDNYIGSSIYLAFRHYDSAGCYYIMIDDVKVGTIAPSGIGEETIHVPTATALKANYPNPFNPSTTIAFDMAASGNTTIDIFNVRGQKVKTVANGFFNAGTHRVLWNGDDHNGNSVGSGVYFYRMTTESYTKTQKMLLMK